MSKITLNDVGNLIDATTAATTINNNSAVIEAAWDNTLSRDGSTPNQMESNLDMNGKNILNLPAPTDDTYPARLGDIKAYINGEGISTVPSGGTAGQVLTKKTNTNYDIDWETNGGVSSVGLSLPSDFTVTNSPITVSGNLTGTWTTTPTGTGAVVRANSPALVTPTGINKSDVGLGNVDNTTDSGKPVSTAQQTALNLKANLASPTFTGTVSGITATMVGLGNVDNTSDANKPVSTAQQTALNLKANLASPTFTGTVSGVTAAMVGLGNVNNTSDATKNSATATLTNKTLTSPVITTPTGIVKGDVGLGNVPNTDCTNASNISSGLLNDNFLNLGVKTITATGSTVNVDLSGCSYILFNPASAATVHTISGGKSGKCYFFWFQNGNTTIDRNSASLIGGASITFTTGQGCLFVCEGTTIRQITAATVAS